MFEGVTPNVQAVVQFKSLDRLLIRCLKFNPDRTGRGCGAIQQEPVACKSQRRRKQFASAHGCINGDESVHAQRETSRVALCPLVISLGGVDRPFARRSRQIGGRFNNTVPDVVAAVAPAFAIQSGAQQRLVPTLERESVAAGHEQTFDNLSALG